MSEPEFIYNAFDVQECKSSIERCLLKGKIPRRYLRKPHMIVISHDHISSGLYEINRGLIPHVFVSMDVFEARYERYVDPKFPDATYIYKLKQL